MAVTRWGGLRIEPYDPDARDADGDGIVQEGTAWERPGGTRLVDRLGRDIQRSLTSTTRPQGMRVVDKDGKDVQYKPSYGEAPGGEKPSGTGKPTPLADRGARSLKEMGLPSLQEINAPRPPVNQESLSTAARPQSEVLDAARNSGRADAIRAKNDSVLEALDNAGGSLFRPDEKYVENNDRRGSIFVARTPAEMYRRQRRSAAAHLQDVREYLRSGETTRLDGSKSRNINTEHIDRLHPDVKQQILSSTDEELLDLIEAQMIKFHEGVSRNVRVRIPRGERLDTFLSEGRYRTTHEARSDHSNAAIRADYERIIGIPPNVDPKLRPASGYVAHPDWGEYSAGPAYVYGSVELVLRPEVAGRSGYGAGDSLNTMLRPVAFGDDDPQAIFTALMSSGGKEEDSVDGLTLGFLESARTGSFANVNSNLGGAADLEKDSMMQRRYFEALVAGSFDASEVEEARMSYADLAHRAVDKSKLDVDAAEQTKKVREEFFTADALSKMGFSEEEIEYLMGLINNYQSWDNTQMSIPAHLVTPEMKQLLEFRVAKDRKSRLEQRGIAVKVISAQGSDPFDPVSYGGSPGDDVEALLKRRVEVALPERARSRREQDRMARERESRGEELGSGLG